MRIRTVLAAAGLATVGLFAGASSASAGDDYSYPPALLHGVYEAKGKYIEMDEEELELGTYSVENLVHAELGKHLR
ncbi:hypothetical protein [Streptomyces sp. URMC 129]|uniref:hypothetical protein n=1 Tax=Streptomyces sp. URMC 129 TaxID=3423407 RepID=UPI003F1D9DC1